MAANYEGICRLCKKPKSLCESHVISKFFYRMQKENSATGKMRDINNPKIRLQDGLKPRLMCQECENRIGKLETSFRPIYAEIFSSREIKPTIFPDSAYKFLISLAWRLLIHTIEFDEKLNYFDYEIGIMKYKEEQFREYLTDSIDTLSNEVHIVPIMEPFIKDARILSFGTYSIGADIQAYARDMIAYINVPYLLFAVYIRHNSQDEWMNTRICEEGSAVWGGYIEIPKCVTEYCIHREAIKYKNLSPETEKKIRELANSKEVMDKVQTLPYYDVKRRIDK